MHHILQWLLESCCEPLHWLVVLIGGAQYPSTASHLKGLPSFLSNSAVKAHDAQVYRIYETEKGGVVFTFDLREGCYLSQLASVL